MTHYIEYCSKCQKVISQCRCASCNKETRYGICDDCKACKAMKTKKMTEREELHKIYFKACVLSDDVCNTKGRDCGNCNADAIQSAGFRKITPELIKRIGELRQIAIWQETLSSDTKVNEYVAKKILEG